MAANPSEPFWGTPGFLVAVIFSAVAAWFWFAGGAASEAVPDLGRTADFPREDLSTDSFRTPLAHPPRIELGGYERTCQDCHALIDSGDRAAAARGDTARVQHEDVVLSHGKNDRCLGCHHPRDRNHLVLLDGTQIRFDEAPRLCTECHGLVGRDWERGIHGRTHGSWRTGSPEQRRLGCTECHDPHSPAYPEIPPLPAPETLRLPDPEERQPHSSEPLWPRSAIKAARGAQE